jgi:hypothetical protein
VSALRPLGRADNNLAHFNKTIGRTRATGGNTMLTTAFIILGTWIGLSISAMAVYTLIRLKLAK